MRIKTITCHDVYNAGASLQAYALSTYLTQLGHQVEIINYKPKYLNNHYPLFGVANPIYDKPFLREVYNLLKLPGRIKARNGNRKKAFDKFTLENLKVTGIKYTSNEQLKEIIPEADIYFAGSDQIWNCFFQNGKDPAFYLDFVPSNCVKASYAASFSQESIPDEWKKQIAEWIDNLDYISVREKTGIQILHDLGVNRGIQVLDPVFLLECREWYSLLDIVSFEDPFVFLYDFDQNDLVYKSVMEYARKKGWKVYSYLPNKYCDRSFEDYGPKMFLSLIKQAEMIVSNSFHATAFSLIFEKNFWVMKRTENINTRMIDLLSIVELNNRLLDDCVNYENDMIDYSIVRSKLHKYICQSKKYIDMVIKKANEK